MNKSIRKLKKNPRVGRDPSWNDQESWSKTTTTKNQGGPYFDQNPGRNQPRLEAKEGHNSTRIQVKTTKNPCRKVIFNFEKCLNYENEGKFQDSRFLREKRIKEISVKIKK